MSERIRLIELDDSDEEAFQNAVDVSQRLRLIEVGEEVPEYAPLSPAPTPADPKPYRSPGAVEAAARGAGARANLEALERFDAPPVEVSDRRRELEALRARVAEANRQEMELLRREAEHAEARVDALRGRQVQTHNARLSGVERGVGSVWHTDDQGRPLHAKDVFGPQVFGGGQW